MGVDVPTRDPLTYRHRAQNTGIFVVYEAGMTDKRMITYRKNAGCIVFDTGFDTADINGKKAFSG
ncbi:hypothetical protein KAM348_43170 [Aeromonas caviae]|uniref:Uncharacterized protein n=1 Tax=Aeromonas caviae TaxID=648 RepID=A0AAI9PCE6_AERCA|nr:hypothetical protein KAM348_43170 [Aeromonas caviae]